MDGLDSGIAFVYEFIGRFASGFGNWIRKVCDHRLGISGAASRYQGATEREGNDNVR
jgi:hypothetical protein